MGQSLSRCAKRAGKLRVSNKILKSASDKVANVLEDLL